MPSKFLIIWDDRSGFQGLANVEVIEAEDEEEVREEMGFTSASYGSAKVYDLDDLPEHGKHWSYYV